MHAYIQPVVKSVSDTMSCQAASSKTCLQNRHTAGKEDILLMLGPALPDTSTAHRW